MRLVSFLQLRNELENGNLVRCLENCKRWSDDIFIYDDCSDDGSQEVYEKYTDKKNIIFGAKKEFNMEQFHKQQLLTLALKTNPDWIGWIDGDTILDRRLTDDCRGYLQGIDDQGFDHARLHNLNLWRHPSFYRMDNSFNNLWHVVFWKNNGKLHYNPKPRLHYPGNPQGISKLHNIEYGYHLLHYGFATKLQIVKKYLTYKSYGQRGWDLDRLIDEKSSYDLVRVEKGCYPEENVEADHDTAPVPPALTYDEYRGFNSWEEFRGTDLHKQLLEEGK